MEGKIYAAISAVMNDVGAVGKNDKNDYDKYKYRGIDAVMNALSPAMVKNHVFVIPQVLESSREERAGKSGGSMIYSVVKVKYSFYTDDGSSVEAVVIGEAMDRSDKSTNKAMSTAFKYACFQTFCIPTEEMVDSEKESPEIEPKHVEEVKESKNAMIAKIFLKMQECQIGIKSIMGTYNKTMAAGKTIEQNLALLSEDELADALRKFEGMAKK